MSVMTEAVADALLRVAAITGTVPSTSIALEQLAQGAAYPAIVYRVISSLPAQRLCAPSGARVARVQINPLANDPGEVFTLHELIRQSIEGDAPRTVAGSTVTGVRFVGYGPASKDEFTGMWTKPADYILHHT